MAEAENKREVEAKSKKKRRNIVLLIMLLLLLLLFWAQWKLGNIKEDALETERKAVQELQEQRRLDSLKALEIPVDTTIVDSIAEDTTSVDTIVSNKIDSNLVKRKIEQKRISDSIAMEKKILDSLRLDSLKKDSISKIDTIPPVAKIMPPPGRYFGKVDLEISCNEDKCQIFNAIDNSAFKAGDKITLTKTSKVEFYAQDDSNNKSKIQSVAYDIAQGSNKCGENMVPIPVGGKDVCMDIYEWPNKSGAKPKAFVSQTEAAKKCGEIGKRLCSALEWQTACKGKDNIAYPYGNLYSPHKCYSSTKELGRSGRKKECRSYYGIYDLSGNVWEWTSTTYERREGYVYATGGAWDSQNQTSCLEKKFSFFPQNQYPFVGFRCCK